MARPACSAAMGCSGSCFCSDTGIFMLFSPSPEHITRAHSGRGIFHRLSGGHHHDATNTTILYPPCQGNVVLSGPLGSGDLVWASTFRGIGPMPSVHLGMQEDLKPLEENGFVIADLTPDKIVLRYFRWNAHRDSIEAIDTLEPFRATELKRPA